MIMKKYLLSLLAAGAMHAQEKHEVKWNPVNTIAFGSVELGYEYFFDDSQSVGVELHINDVYNWAVGRQAKDFKSTSVVASYTFYTGSDVGSGVMITPQMKFRGGHYQKTSGSPEVSLNSFMLGIGAGYKWNLSGSFVFGPYGMIGRNFSQEIQDEFGTPVEFSVGFSVGLRF